MTGGLPVIGVVADADTDRLAAGSRPGRSHPDALRPVDPQNRDCAWYGCRSCAGQVHTARLIHTSDFDAPETLDNARQLVIAAFAQAERTLHRVRLGALALGGMRDHRPRHRDRACRSRAERLPQRHRPALPDCVEALRYIQVARSGRRPR